MDADEVTPQSLGDCLELWKTSCMEDAEPPEKSLEELESDTLAFFVEEVGKDSEASEKVGTPVSHDEALAQVVQKLGPAFTATHHKSRLRALSVLSGAIKGCKGSSVSNKMTQLIGKFLLGHCGPIDDDQYEEDYDTLIRDSALSSLSALLQIATAGTTKEDVMEALEMRAEFAREGVVRRCAAADKDSTPDPYGSVPPSGDIRGGLSTLPRSKRSLCFDLLRSAVTGVEAISHKAASNATAGLQTTLADFVRFVASTMHGESDPRCLQQLLQLIQAVQMAFQPYFEQTKSQTSVFPIEDVFDAVAPYYPIQFTPPPNDIHGITRQGLSTTLMQILTFTQLDAESRRYNRQTMVTLSADLFLEQLLPPEERPTALEQVEAIECLSTLLLSGTEPAAINQIEVRTLRAMCEALKATHDEASLSAADGGGKSAYDNKAVADHCRTLVSKIAYQLESATREGLWEAFVEEPLQNQSAKIKMSPAYSKTTIAYIACLTASGGLRTLKTCLATGLQPLMEFLGDRLEDSEDTAAATHGIGAFISSCQVALERAEKEGVVLHPHPLDPYAAKLGQLLLDAFEMEEGKLSLSTKVGVLRALQCLLVVAQEGHLADAVNRMCSFVTALMKALVDEASLHGDSIQWKTECSSALGRILAESVVVGEGHSKALLVEGPLQDTLKQDVFPTLVESTTRESGEKERFDRKTLAVACSGNEKIADQVVSSCLETLGKSLTENGIDDSSVVPAAAISYLLENGGDFAIHAYHRSPNVDTILGSLKSFANTKPRDDFRVSVAKLALPDTPEDKEAVKKEVGAVNKLVSSLIPAYNKCVPRHRLVQLLKGVSAILPPLSEADTFELLLWLPILGTALNGTPYIDDDAMDTDESIEEIACSLSRDLAELVLDSGFDTGARSAAAACLHATITLRVPGAECPVRPIIAEVVNPSLAGDVNLETAQDQLNLMGLTGSAAALRGGSSSTTAHEIANFFVHLACMGKAPLPFYTEGEVVMHSTRFEEPDDRLAFELRAASAYGSMLANNNMKPLMKQRLTHLSLKHIKHAYDTEREQAKHGEAVVPPKVGLLAVVCHLVCACDLSRFDQTTKHQLSTLVVEGLASELFAKSEEESAGAKLTAIKNLALAAMLKVICLIPSVVNGFVLSVVTGLLRAYAVSDPTSESSCKLLALQCLEGIAHMDGVRSSAAAIQPAVVSVLAAATNHPSGLLRQAAVDVRNAWYVLA